MTSKIQFPNEQNSTTFILVQQVLTLRAGRAGLKDGPAEQLRGAPICYATSTTGNTELVTSGFHMRISPKIISNLVMCPQKFSPASSYAEKV
jgi:hypothetical protein